MLLLSQNRLFHQETYLLLCTGKPVIADICLNNLKSSYKIEGWTFLISVLNYNSCWRYDNGCVNQPWRKVARALWLAIDLFKIPDVISYICWHSADIQPRPDKLAWAADFLDQSCPPVSRYCTVQVGLWATLQRPVFFLVNPQWKSSERDLLILAGFNSSYEFRLASPKMA